MAHPEWSAAEAQAADTLIALALAEDLDHAGDLTSQAVIPADGSGVARFVARSAGVIAGLPIAAAVFARLDARCDFTPLVADGTAVAAGTVVAEVAGPLRALLTAERTALNFVQRLSGIASLTQRFVAAVQGLPCQVLDTRKTLPGWRRLEKYAVRCGGGTNHRQGLFDAVMLKDNHLAAIGGGAGAVRRGVDAARAEYDRSVPIEVEVETFDQLDAALAAQPDIIMLDNMDVGMLRAAVARRDDQAPSVRLEASGGISLQNIRAVAETGVDLISIGALTHSAPALDVALDFVRN
ncbi:MAG TPA: carboxylating nicotinate-nucleotide diphosphorylase [Gemmatales bacterium]|nr:carboxylating nicotinate-nucleotide diphosphorylase [Gemmatales bacterium]HMP57887.1 carboxylating nicotinate-nucleotide diphosphorylase [Gemmatales bacterium]